jgi:hypothetical protein
MPDVLPRGVLLLREAMGDKNTPHDQVMKLGASLLFSGFRHVIATMGEQ